MVSLFSPQYYTIFWMSLMLLHILSCFPAAWLAYWGSVNNVDTALAHHNVMRTLSEKTQDCKKSCIALIMQSYTLFNSVKLHRWSDTFKSNITSCTTVLLYLNMSCWWKPHSTAHLFLASSNLKLADMCCHPLSIWETTALEAGSTFSKGKNGRFFSCSDWCCVPPRSVDLAGTASSQIPAGSSCSWFQLPSQLGVSSCVKFLVP